MMILVFGVVWVATEAGHCHGREGTVAGRYSKELRLSCQHLLHLPRRSRRSYPPTTYYEHTESSFRGSHLPVRRVSYFARGRSVLAPSICPERCFCPYGLTPECSFGSLRAEGSMVWLDSDATRSQLLWSGYRIFNSRVILLPCTSGSLIELATRTINLSRYYCIYRT